MAGRVLKREESLDVRCFEPNEVKVCYPPKERCRASEALKRVRGLKVCSFGERDIDGFKVLGVGFRGVVILGKLEGKFVAIKLPRTDWRGSFRKEAEIQKLAYPVSPKVMYYDDDIIIMEYVDCPDIRDVLPTALKDREALAKLIERVLRAGRELDRRGIDHGELVRPWKHVKVCEDKVKILDYGSASLSRKVRNVSSLVSGLLLKPSEPALSIARTLNVDKALVMEKLRLYKRTLSDESFEELLGSIIRSGST